jgi:hypothetical protein
VPLAESAALHPGDRHVGGCCGDVHAAHHPRVHRHDRRRSQAGSGIPSEICRHRHRGGGLPLHGKHPVTGVGSLREGGPVYDYRSDTEVPMNYSLWRVTAFKLHTAINRFGMRRVWHG